MDGIYGLFYPGNSGAHQQVFGRDSENASIAVFSTQYFASHGAWMNPLPSLPEDQGLPGGHAMPVPPMQGSQGGASLSLSSSAGLENSLNPLPSLPEDQGLPGDHAMRIPLMQRSQGGASLYPSSSAGLENPLNLSPNHPGWANPAQRPPVYTCVMKINRWYAAASIRSNGMTFYQKHRDVRVMLQAIQTLAQISNLPHANYLMLMEKPIITVSEYQGRWFPYALYPDHANRLISSVEDNGFDNREAAEAMAIRMARTKQSSFSSAAAAFMPSPQHVLI